MISMWSMGSARVVAVAAVAALGCEATDIVGEESRSDLDPREPAVAAVAERSAPAAVDVDVVGTWYSCGAIVEFADYGTWQIDGFDGCTSSGRWTVEGNRLTWSATRDDCRHPVALGETAIVRSDNALVLTHSSYPRGVLVLLDETTPRSTWELSGTIDDLATHGTSTVWIVGTPRAGFASGCYLSKDGECGGLISCGGWVEIWNVGEGFFTAKTSCGGPCPCGAVLSGTPQPDGSIVGKYNAANCGRRFGGDFTLTRLSE
jgi:hypothetical protein